MTDASVCVSCAAGKYGPTAGASNCLNCEAGKVSGKGRGSCDDCGGGQIAEDQTRCLTCGAGSGSKVHGPYSGLSLPMTTSIRLCLNFFCTDNPPMFPGSMFDENGEVQGRLELKVGGEWVTVSGIWNHNGTEVGCRQLGNELGYTLLSWGQIGYEGTPDGSGKQYYAKNCKGNEGDLSSCGEFYETSPAVHADDVGLRCTFVIAGDECEECPLGKYRYACARVGRRG